MSGHSRALMLAKIAQCFPTHDARAVLAILDQYGQESFEREIERVQVAIIKLSCGAFEKLEEHVAMAKRDYRDVLAYAEFPEEMQNETWKLDDQTVKEIRERDRRQYREWIMS